YAAEPAPPVTAERAPTLTIAPPAGSRRAAARHVHHAVPRLRSSRERSCSGSESATLALRKPPAAFTTQRGVAGSPSQYASTASASVRSTSSRPAMITSSPRAPSTAAIAAPSAPRPPQTRARSATNQLQELPPQLGV